MAPALDISNQNNDKYTHKKFQGKRNYAHKKFGTRLAATIAAASEDHTQTHLPVQQEFEQQKVVQTFINTKRSSADIFRPYALPDTTPRKRKHHELQTEQTEECLMEVKRFAPSCMATPSPSPPPQALSPVLPFSGHFMQPSPMMINPYYRPQHYQFNPQTFALILQKQRAALCMGEMLKRQANFNLYNLMGQ
ncbi:uncharacterized protein LOC135950242 [Calliphora vicina]|uniref:uncharacterized protein LOC135950242 n=1 Tax=Calliphora vicina TaxID=7373 RepID=UPI00325BB69A